MSRRAFLTTLALSTAGLAGAAASCAIPGLSDPKASGSARLAARPGTPSLPGPLGLRRLGLEESVDGSMYVPATYSPSTPAPLLLLLHGAGGNAANFISGRIVDADANGLLLLAVDSRRTTWDGVNSNFGPDIAFLDRALADVFARYAVDPARVGVAGFSDGATMSLGLAVANGDLFARAIAWSPGFLIGTRHTGKSAFFITHGIGDPVLPIGSASRQIVPALRRDGYDVTYREFIGVHELPAALQSESMAWAARRT